MQRARYRQHPGKMYVQTAALRTVHIVERPVAGGTTYYVLLVCRSNWRRFTYSSLYLERGMLIDVQKALVCTVGANPAYIILARILSSNNAYYIK